MSHLQIFLCSLAGAFVLLVAIGVGGLVSQDREKSTPIKIYDKHSRAVAVIVFDLTEQRPIARRGEIWMRGVGSKFLSKSIIELGQRKVGEECEIVLYVDGRQNAEHTIEFVVSEEMTIQRSTKHSIMLTIFDDKIEAVGTCLGKSRTIKFTR